MDPILIGRVARAHGNRGEVIVNLETDFAEDRFQAGRIVQVGAIDRLVPHRIERVRFHQGRPIVAFEGVATMNDAEALAGTDLWMEAADLGPLPPETFYRHDLIGCEVRTGSGEVVGQVSGRTLVVGPGVCALVSASWQTELTGEQFYQEFVSIAHALGFIVTEQGSVTTITLGSAHNDSSTCGKYSNRQDADS